MSTNPADGALAVAVDRTINATFSEAMDPDEAAELASFGAKVLTSAVLAGLAPGRRIVTDGAELLDQIR